MCASISHIEIKFPQTSTYYQISYSYALLYNQLVSLFKSPSVKSFCPIYIARHIEATISTTLLTIVQKQHLYLFLARSGYSKNNNNVLVTHENNQILLRKTKRKFTAGKDWKFYSSSNKQEWVHERVFINARSCMCPWKKNRKI